MPRDHRASAAQQARDARWEAARADAERIARAEVERMEYQLERLDPHTQQNRVREVSARRGAALHELRRTLLLQDWMEHLRVTSPTRYRRLLGDADTQH
jgi:prolyl-tRNA editing enzyme YbaK/EbsC (Cys-tRNA(Pro) deacylase)